MLMRTLGIATVSAAMLLGRGVIAQQEAPKAPAAAAPASTNEAIARWIDDRVIGIVVVDLSKADLGALIGQIADAAGKTEVPGRPRAEFDKMREEMTKAREVVDKWVSDFKGAGGREAWFVISPKPAIVVPLAPDADSEKLSDLLNTLDAVEGSKAMKRDGFLIAGNPLRGLPLAEPTKADQVKAARGSVDDVAPVATAVLTPSDPHKLMLGAVLAELSKNTGTEIPKDLNLKVVWAAIGVSNAPGADLKLVIQGTNNTAGQQIASTMNSVLGFVSKQAQVGSLVEVLRELKFIANEDKAELTIRAATTKRIIQGTILPLVMARESARQVKAMSQARQMLVAVHSYAADKQEALPESMDAIAEDYLGGMDLTHPSGKKWKYSKTVKRLTEIADPSEYVLLYEEYKNWPTQGVIVGFADGHVELIKDEARFKDLTKGR